MIEIESLLSDQTVILKTLKLRDVKEHETTTDRGSKSQICTINGPTHDLTLILLS